MYRDERNPGILSPLEIPEPAKRATEVALPARDLCCPFRAPIIDAARDPGLTPGAITCRRFAALTSPQT